ncbi:hypothetical protein [Bacteroides sp.]
MSGMIHLLTTKETLFLTKLAALLKEYDAVFSHGLHDEIDIMVYEGQENTERIPISFHDSFDENEIFELLTENSMQIDFIAKTKKVWVFSDIEQNESNIRDDE